MAVQGLLGTRPWIEAAAGASIAIQCSGYHAWGLILLLCMESTYDYLDFAFARALQQAAEFE